MFKKAAALILCAAMAVPAVNAAAAQPIQTEVIVNEYAASAKEWNGKTALASGKSYTVSGKVTVSSAVTIPSGTTLTVANGGKLTVSSKGTLNVKGTLSVKSGAAMTVNGKLKLYSGKKLTVGGTLKFGKSSTATLNGKVTVNSFGTIVGEPKKASAGTKASLKASGVVDSAKIAKAFGKTSDTEQIVTKWSDIAKAMFINADISGVLKKAYPKGVYESLEAEYNSSEEAAYQSFDETMNSLGQFLVAILASEYGSLPTGVDTSGLTVKYLGKSDIPEADESVAEYYKNITAAAAVGGKYALQFGNDSVEMELDDAYLVKIGGAWYVYIGYAEEIM